MSQEKLKPSFAPKQVVPGPCPPEGCPPPTEIVCIRAYLLWRGG